ncbi:MAG: DUF302 domain-containing protein [Candidatus Thermoplasmatota archaeon]
MQYALRKTTSKPFAQAVARARELIAKEGFGILCEIDIQAKMKEKLGRDMPPYLILGACAPPLAWKVLGVAPDVGVFLPCNVCVYVDATGKTVVSAIDPDTMEAIIHNPTVAEVAKEVKGRLQRVVDGTAA